MDEHSPGLEYNVLTPPPKKKKKKKKGKNRYVGVQIDDMNLPDS